MMPGMNGYEVCAALKASVGLCVCGADCVGRAGFSGSAIFQA
jgi:CheY-like chemotaxis protein